MSYNPNKPAPQDYGWTYQGRNEQSRVDFYQRDDVKMDHYYTTGTVKTSMEHPSQGNTQMFRRDLNDHDLGRVYENPRAHTGAGYQRTENRPYTKK